MVEQLALNQLVVGSNPSLGTISKEMAATESESKHRKKNPAKAGFFVFDRYPHPLRKSSISAVADVFNFADQERAIGLCEQLRRLW